jgi:hypothetical protein
MKINYTFGTANPDHDFLPRFHWYDIVISDFNWFTKPSRSMEWQHASTISYDDQTLNIKYIGLINLLEYEE